MNNQSFSVIGTQLRNYTISVPPSTARILVLSSTPLVDVEDEEAMLPTEYSVSQNFPNPFNPSTRIQYSLPYSSTVKISIFNILGEKVTDLINGEMSAGYHDVDFNASRLASGVYIYRIKAGDFVETKKMVLMK